jgi:hypothetical protein
MNEPVAAALAALDSLQSFTESQALVLAKCRALIYGYDARWQNSPYAIESAEEVVTAELWNPETNRRSRSFTLAGKIDVNAFHGERRVLIDHKTTSEDISDPNSTYWRQLAIEGQAAHYMLMQWLNGAKVDDAVWDVMRKPETRPKKVESKIDRAQILRESTYFGVRLSYDSLRHLRETDRESYEMYEARLRWDCTENRPEWYFQRRSVPRLDAQLREWAGDLWGHSQDLLIARREGRWPKNSGACMTYGRPCKFLGLCSGYDTPESDRWRRKKWMHAELPVVEGQDGRDVLTMSRIRTFQTCRQKHYLEYELGIERTDEDEAEALYFGNCWHLALEAYFLNQKEQQQNGNATDSPENGFGAVADNEAALNL